MAVANSKPNGSEVVRILGTGGGRMQQVTTSNRILAGEESFLSPAGGTSLVVNEV